MHDCENAYCGLLVYDIVGGHYVYMYICYQGWVSPCTVTSMWSIRRPLRVYSFEMVPIFDCMVT
jgi:hypothetical protein